MAAGGFCHQPTRLPNWLISPVRSSGSRTPVAIVVWWSPTSFPTDLSERWGSSFNSSAAIRLLSSADSAILGQHINNPPCLKVASGLREDQ